MFIYLYVINEYMNGRLILDMNNMHRIHMTPEMPLCHQPSLTTWGLTRCGGMLSSRWGLMIGFEKNIKKPTSLWRVFVIWELPTFADPASLNCFCHSVNTGNAISTCRTHGPSNLLAPGMQKWCWRFLKFLWHPEVDEVWFPVLHHIFSYKQSSIISYLKDKLVIEGAFPDACRRLSAMAFTMAFPRIATAVFRRGAAQTWRATNPKPSTRIRDKCDWPSMDKIVSALCVCVLCAHINPNKSTLMLKGFEFRHMAHGSISRYFIYRGWASRNKGSPPRKGREGTPFCLI